MAGKTGSGKTTLAKHLLSQRDNVLVLDTKTDLNWPGFTVTESLEEAFKEKKDGTHTIFRPTSAKSIWLFYQRAYEEGGWTVYTDEIYQIGRGTIQSFPTFYVRGLTAGRSKGVTMVTATQRPKYLPLFAVTESTHIFVFELSSEQDRKDLAKLAGIDDLQRPVGRYEFLYHNSLSGKTITGKLRLR